jgi:hypothetical protein
MSRVSNLAIHTSTSAKLSVVIHYDGHALHTDMTLGGEIR